MITELKHINTELVRSKMPGMPESKKDFPVTDFSRRKLDQFYQYWVALQENRVNWQKWAKYYTGDQWHEYISDGAGGYITESEYISNQGKIPLQQNIIKPTCNSIIGQFRSNKSNSVIVPRMKDKAKESEMLSNALQYVHTLNSMREMDAAALEQKLVTGLPVQMIRYKYLEEEKRYDVWVDNLNPHTMFFNPDVIDVRGADIRVIGRIIDLTFPELVIAFGQNNRNVIRQLKDIYQHRDDMDYIANEGLTSQRIYDTDFFLPKDFTKCRVIEAWEKVPVMRTRVHDEADGSLNITEYTLEEIEYMNKKRVEKYMAAGKDPSSARLMDAQEIIVRVWHYQFLSPFGHILMEGESPYWHGSHHFVMPLFQLYDGKLNSFVADLIDQQRYINRLITLWDFILGTSAKNTLVLDTDSLNGQNPEDIADDYREVGGVIVLKLKDGAKPPFELGKNAANLGITEMIKLHMELIQDISGVHASLQGKQARSGVPASLYAQEAQNASVNIKSILDSFNVFRKDRDEKVLKTIQQFYNEPRWIAVSGADYEDSAQLYEPKDVQDLEFTLEIAQSADSPVYRGIIDEQLKEFLMAGLIDFETYLKNTNLPFSQKILEDVRKAKEEAMQGNMAGAGAAIGNAQQSVPGNQQAVDMLKRGIEKGI
jgi:hypothetical protein